MKQTIKRYRVGRYFDDVFEIWVTGFLSKEEAKKVKDKLTDPYSAYVSFEIREGIENFNKLERINYEN